jgi:uncharacterized protein with HEPN domain
MTEADKKLLFDVLIACDEVEAFNAGKSYEDYLDDNLLRAGTERKFEIIGEALVRLQRLSPNIAARITDSRNIIAFRNRIIHGYDTVDDTTVYGILQQYVPVLRMEVMGLLQESDA